MAALDNRTIDAYASDRTILIGMGRTSKSPEKLSLVEEFFSYEPHGFVLKRGDAGFRLVRQPRARGACTARARWCRSSRSRSGP